MLNNGITLVGATGNVGRMVIQQLLERQITTPEHLLLLASPQSAGRTLLIGGHSFSIEETNDKTIAQNKLCIFTTDSDISSHFVPKALNAGCYVIDSSAHFRLEADTLLIVPPVNGHLISGSTHFYTTANCLAAPTSIALSPLKKNGLCRVEITTYQSTSGAGKLAMDECWNETKSLTQGIPFKRKHFSHPIAFNVIPHIGTIQNDGFSSEELKIIKETQKVLETEALITATAVRVPVMIGHSIALTAEFHKSFELAEVIQLLKDAPFVQLSSGDYSTPQEVVGTDEVFIGRIRRNPSVQNGIHLWLCSDNLRRGASTDIVEIAAALSKNF